MPGGYNDEDIDSILSSIQQGQPAHIPISAPVDPKPAPEPVMPVHDLSRSSIFRSEPQAAPRPELTQPLPVLESVTEVKPTETPKALDEPKQKKAKRSLFRRKEKPKKATIAPQKASKSKQQPYIPYLSGKEHTAKTSPAKPLKRKRKLSKWVLYAPAVIIFVIGTGILAAKPIGAMLEPKSPFAEKTKLQYSFPLYYPTKPPSGYKIELDSIRSAEGQPVAVMGVSNDSGQAFTVAQQIQPIGMTLDSVRKILQNTRDIYVPSGEAVTGNNEENRDVTNILTGKTWIIITAPKGQLTPEQIDQLSQSFKQG